MKKLNTTSVIVRNEEGQFLGVSRRKNYNDFGLAGGKCERKESFEDCAKRELLEETGLIAKELKLIDIRDYTNRYSKPATLDTVYCYEVTKYEGELHTVEYLKEKGEGMLKWLSDADLVLYGTFNDYNRAILKEYYDLKTVWTVDQQADYGDSQVIGIFTTEAKAIKYVEDLLEYKHKYEDNHYNRKELRFTRQNERVWRGSSETIEIEECILDGNFIGYGDV